MPLRIGAALMLAAAIVFPLLPGHGIVLCPLRLATGIPCPLCGMTTSVAATGRGRFAEALAANPAGLLAVVVAVALLVVRPPQVRIPIAVGLIAIAAMWVFQLFRFSIL